MSCTPTRIDSPEGAVHAEPLVKMANEIASFFVSGNEEDEATRLIADHLRRFWEPRMRRALIAHWQTGGDGLKPAVMKAVGLLAAERNG